MASLVKTRRICDSVRIVLVDNSRGIVFSLWYQDKNCLVYFELSRGIREPRILSKELNNSLSEEIKDNLSPRVAVENIVERDG